MDRQPFLTHCFALVICRYTDGRWLCVKETRNRGWWVAGGLVEPGEDFYAGAIRETKEEAGVDIQIEGILRVEHSICGKQTARMRVIFYATSTTAVPKQIADDESECAAWLSVQEIEKLAYQKPGLRGYEIIAWPKYIENGGLIAPISFLRKESDEVKIMKPITISNYPSVYENENVRSTELLQKALNDEDIPMVKHLLIMNVDPNEIINQKNWTSLHFAIKTKNEDLVKCLLISGAKCELMTHKSRNAIHFGVQANLKILKMLMLSLCEYNNTEMKDVINQQDIDGNTPLHFAMMDMVRHSSDDPSIVNYLIQSGADVNIKNNSGETPMDFNKFQNNS